MEDNQPSIYLFPGKVDAYGIQQLLIESLICAPGTQHDWVNRSSVKYNVCQTLQHITNAE